MESENDVYLDCSDNESYGLNEIDKWMPPVEKIINLYEEINQRGCLDLEWQCPGRRSPTPAKSVNMNVSHPDHIDEISPQNNSDFDFQEELNQLNISVRKSGEGQLKGSAKKKTTTFDAVLMNMARHRKMDTMINDTSGS